jgi:hypothetical protein
LRILLAGTADRGIARTNYVKNSQSHIAHRKVKKLRRLPASLDELISAGYIQFVPMDPYSNGPLVYKPAGDNFKLYSVGYDFSDDGGSNEETRAFRWEYLVLIDMRLISFTGPSKN